MPSWKLACGKPAVQPTRRRGFPGNLLLQSCLVLLRPWAFCIQVFLSCKAGILSIDQHSAFLGAINSTHCRLRGPSVGAEQGRSFVPPAGKRIFNGSLESPPFLLQPLQKREGGKEPRASAFKAGLRQEQGGGRGAKEFSQETGEASASAPSHSQEGGGPFRHQHLSQDSSHPQTQMPATAGAERDSTTPGLLPASPSSTPGDWVQRAPLAWSLQPHLCRAGRSGVRCPVWVTTSQKEGVVEQVQKRPTKMIGGLRPLPNEEGRQHLGLFSQDTRRGGGGRGEGVMTEK